MSSPLSTEPRGSAIPRLQPGDHLDQARFHERYAAMPPGTRAELIGGVVYLPSPVGRRHAKYHAFLVHLLWEYSARTPGTESYDGASVILGDRSEPQPDALLIRTGGQTTVTEAETGPDGEKETYISGPPELVVEVASSTVAYDLHSKKRDYEEAGVQEYFVIIVREGRLVWFVREEDRFVELLAGQDGVFRSRVFPGLWLAEESVVNLDHQSVRQLLGAGLGSVEHAEFGGSLSGD